MSTNNPDWGNMALKAALAHVAGGGSINIQGPPPQQAPGAGGAPGAPMGPPPPPPIPGFLGFATDPANFAPIAASINTQKNQPTPFNHPPPPPPLSIFNPRPNLFPLSSPSSPQQPTFSPPSFAGSAPAQAPSSSQSTGAMTGAGTGSMPQLPPPTPAGVSPAIPASVAGTQSTADAPSLPAQTPTQVNPGLMSYSEWAAAHPDQVAHRQGDTLASRLMILATSALAGAAGGMHGDPMAGVRYAQGIADYNNSIPDVYQQRYEAGAVKPYQQALTDKETQARINELSRPQNVQTVQTADGVMQRNSSTGAWTKIGDNPSENKTDTPENQFLQDFLKRNPKATIGDAIKEYTTITSKPDQKPDGIQQQYTDEFLKRHPGATIEEAVKAYSSATQKPERGDGGGSYLPMYDQQGNVHFFNPKTGAISDPPKNFGKTDPTKQNDAYQGIVDEATGAHQLQKMAESGNAEADADLALSFFKVMKGANGSGIRFTQTEQNLIKNARSSSQDLQGIAQKVIGKGQMFTPQQRQNIVDIIDLHANQARNHLGGNATPDADAAASKTPAQSPMSAALPPKIAAVLDDGHAHTFKNGQTWVKRNGQPMRLK